MSIEAFGDEPWDNVLTEEHVERAFREGAQACREMLARFVEQGGDAATAQSIRLNWCPSWGTDPGILEGEIPLDAWGTTQGLVDRCRGRALAIAAAARQGGDVEQAPGEAPQSGDSEAGASPIRNNHDHQPT